MRFFYVRLRTYAQYASINVFTCSENSVRSKKHSTGNQPLRHIKNHGPIVRESAQERDEEDVDIDSGIEIWEKNSIKRMVCKDFDLYYSVMLLKHKQATVTM